MNNNYYSYFLRYDIQIRIQKFVYLSRFAASELALLKAEELDLLSKVELLVVERKCRLAGSSHFVSVSRDFSYL